MPKDTIETPLIGRAASVRAESIDAEARTVEICWTTGAEVQRARFVGWDIEFYREELDVTPEALRLDRLNSGAPFLNTHFQWDLEHVIGVVVEDSVRIEDGKGYATIRFSKRDEVEPIWRDIQDGILRHVSVGYKVHRYEITKTDGELDLWRAVDWEPMEISAVPIPADPGAGFRSEGSGPATYSCVLNRKDDHAAAAAPKEGMHMPKPNQPAAGQQEGRTEPTDEQRNAPPPPANPPAPDAAAAPDADAIRTEERQRTATINQLCRRHGLDTTFSDDLIARGVSIEDARSAILDRLADEDPLEGRTSEPAPAQPRGNGARDAQYRDALTTAVMHRLDPAGVQMTADAREFRGLSLLEIARGSLERQGVSTRGMSKMELSAAVFQQRAAVGYHSTSDFPGILSNVANRTLRAGYDSTPRTFTPWARRTTITDFRPVERHQIGGAPDLEKVLEAGEFQYGTIGEGKETYALATYGKIIGFTRQMLINDDLEAFARLPRAFGASAADLESDIVYAILAGNPTMADGTALFHADHGNLGSAAVIDEASLAAADEAFSKQKGLEGRLISIRPRFLVTPTGQRWLEGRKQMTATTPNGTADVNAYAGSYEQIAEPRLLPSSGQAPWFLIADPSRIDTVEYAYLEGQEGVYTETRMGFEADGIEIKARHDFAAKAIDYRGMYKNPGASPS